jgi:GT2 family glycosyltransferase
MRATVVITAHNEGKLLAKTVASCLEAVAGMDCEILVANDASKDGSVEETLSRFPAIRAVSHRRRRGCATTKDLGARHARGDVLVFLDGHAKPERYGIVRLVRGVEEVSGDAVITPRIPALDVERWENQMFYAGHGHRLGLEKLDGSWIRLDEMRTRGRFYESPSLVGCCVAVSRGLYEKLKGFDRDMLHWGVEDADFGLKAWLMGHSILHDPTAIIGHRFRASFDNFSISGERVTANRIRMARKNFTDGVWKEWLEKLRWREGEETFGKAWALYAKEEASAEEEREYLFRHRTRDEFWYADRFGLAWPARETAAD